MDAVHARPRKVLDTIALLPNAICYFQTTRLFTTSAPRRVIYFQHKRYFVFKRTHCRLVADPDRRRYSTATKMIGWVCNAPGSALTETEGRLHWMCNVSGSVLTETVGWFAADR